MVEFLLTRSPVDDSCKQVRVEPMATPQPKRYPGDSKTLYNHLDNH